MGVKIFSQMNTVPMLCMLKSFSVDDLTAEIRMIGAEK